MLDFDGLVFRSMVAKKLDRFVKKATSISENAMLASLDDEEKSPKT